MLSHWAPLLDYLEFRILLHLYFHTKFLAPVYPTFCWLLLKHGWTQFVTIGTKCYTIKVNIILNYSQARLATNTTECLLLFSFPRHFLPSLISSNYVSLNWPTVQEKIHISGYSQSVLCLIVCLMLPWKHYCK